MKRIVEDELLDLKLGTPDEVQLCLDDLRGVNRRLGGNALHIRLIAQAAEPYLGMHGNTAPLHVLEVASGRADVLQAALLPLHKQGLALKISLLDADAHHLPAPDHWNAELPAPERLVGDALHLPFANNSVDIVSCCLFLHHLDPPQIADFLQEALRVARIAVVINDLERSFLHLTLARMGRFVFRSKLTAYDAKVSVRRAYTLAELRIMLAATGHRSQASRYAVCRVGGIVWK